MADRILVWHVESIVGDGKEQGPTYYMDQDYTPSALRVMVKRAPDAGALSFDIRDDGVSIFAASARLEKGDKTEDAADRWGADPVTIKEGSLVTLDITSNGAQGITIQLELVAP